MKKHNSNRAILVLESPWNLDNGDANRSSVLPFVEGVAKLAGDTEVFHANFYDTGSFKQALTCLCKTSFQNTTVYIAAHGFKGKVVGVKIIDLLCAIAVRSKTYNITGVMLGSCFVGEKNNEIKACIEDSNLKWCAGYSSTSEWLTGTMIDCAILSTMSDLDLNDFSDRSILIGSFADAIAPFSNTFIIGEDYGDNPVCLKDSMQFVIQPRGQGNRASNVSSEVFKTRQLITTAATM